MEEKIAHSVAKPWNQLRLQLAPVIIGFVHKRLEQLNDSIIRKVVIFLG
jgi:hypothetical protein